MKDEPDPQQERQLRHEQRVAELRDAIRQAEQERDALRRQQQQQREREREQREREEQQRRRGQQ